MPPKSRATTSANQGGSEPDDDNNSASPSPLSSALAALTQTVQTLVARLDIADANAQALQQSLARIEESSASPRSRRRTRSPSLDSPHVGTSSKTRFQLTESISTLEDGTDPSFIQWKLSLLDRLEVNADKYPTTKSRMALVWGSTGKRARGYLEPRYRDDSTTPFTSAEEMIQLLESYFLTGLEEEHFRTLFHDLRMKSSDTFLDFRAQFQSAAIQGRVADSEWFFFMWSKLTPRLQLAAAAVKHTWNKSYPVMVTSLTALDTELSRIKESSKPAVTNPTRDPTTIPTLTLPSPAPVPPLSEVQCYYCKQMGHYKGDCPVLARKELEKAGKQ